MKNLIVIASCLLLLGCATTSSKKELKLAHGLDITHPVHGAMVFMAERLAEKSAGKFTIQIYPSGQLGGERELLELLQIGSLAMTKVSTATAENFAPNFEVLGLPYLFRSAEHQFQVLDGPVGEELLLEGEKFRFHGLCFYDAGARSFYTKTRKIEEPKDLKGLKIRVMKSPTAIQMVEQFGGSPTPIAYGELYSALQQGVVDGAENNPPSFYSSRHYEVCKFYTIDEHTYVPDVLMIGMEWWGRLSDLEQRWLKEAAMESAEYERVLWKKSVAESLAAVKAAGVEVIYPDKTTFSELVTPLFESYKDQKEKYDLINRIRAYGAED